MRIMRTPSKNITAVPKPNRRPFSRVFSSDQLVGLLRESPTASVSPRVNQGLNMNARGIELQQTNNNSNPDEISNTSSNRKPFSNIASAANVSTNNTNRSVVERKAARNLAPVRREIPLMVKESRTCVIHNVTFVKGKFHIVNCAGARFPDTERKSKFLIGSDQNVIGGPISTNKEFCKTFSGWLKNAERDSDGERFDRLKEDLLKLVGKYALEVHNE